MRAPEPPPQELPLSWMSDLTHHHASLRTAALALAEISPTSVEQVAKFDASLLDWRRESLVNGWVPAVKDTGGH